MQNLRKYEKNILFLQENIKNRVKKKIIQRQKTAKYIDLKLLKFYIKIQYRFIKIEE